MTGLVTRIDGLVQSIEGIVEKIHQCKDSTDETVEVTSPPPDKRPKLQVRNNSHQIIIFIYCDKGICNS